MKDNKQLMLNKRRQRFFDRCESRAEKIAHNKKRFTETLRKARKTIEKLHNLPKCEALLNNLCNICDLLADYLDGIYRNFPFSTVVMLLVGVLWAVIPFDTIPDFIPLLGWIDDAAVVAGIVVTVQKDINEYLEWKREQSVTEGDFIYE